MSEIFVVGDIHGQHETLVALLRDAELIDQNLAWAACDKTLWLMGDLVDHGPDGVAVIELVMRLQREAALAGGYVVALFGNHDVLFMAAHRFGTAPSSGDGGSFLAEWENNGGNRRDLERLTPEHVDWLTSLPAMARVGDDLLVHADALFYIRYGISIAAVNAALGEILHGEDAGIWNRLLAEFAEHHAFLDGNRGIARARAFLMRYGGTRIIHGHSPINSITECEADDVWEPLVYAGGLCIDVDGGMYLGGKGFVFRLH